MENITKIYDIVSWQGQIRIGHAGKMNKFVSCRNNAQFVSRFKTQMRVVSLVSY